MTAGVPNLSASNPQPGELGIQSRMTVRMAPTQATGALDLKTMGAAPSRGGLTMQAPIPQSQSWTPE